MGNVTFVPHAWAEKEIATVRVKEKEQKNGDKERIRMWGQPPSAVRRATPSKR